MRKTESPDFRGAYSRFKTEYETSGKNLEEILNDFGRWQRAVKPVVTDIQRSQIDLQHNRETAGVFERLYKTKAGETYSRFRDIITGKMISRNEIKKDKLDIIAYEDWKEMKRPLTRIQREDERLRESSRRKAERAGSARRYTERIKKG